MLYWFLLHLIYIYIALDCLVESGSQGRLPRHAKTSLFTKHLPGRVTSKEKPISSVAPLHGSCHSCRSRKRRVESSKLSQAVQKKGSLSGWKPRRSTSRSSRFTSCEPPAHAMLQANSPHSALSILAQVANGRHSSVDGRDVRQVRTQEVVVQVLRPTSIWSAIQRVDDPPKVATRSLPEAPRVRGGVIAARIEVDVPGSSKKAS